MFTDPILLLTYKRPKTTRIILKKILSINPKRIYVFQDGPKKKFTETDKTLYIKTSNLIKKAQTNNKKNTIIFKRFKYNVGQKFIAKKILDVVFKKEKKIIFLEDDTYPDKSFFYFCSQMLKKFEYDKDIYHISGCNLFYGVYKKKINKQKIFLSKYPQFWGWATWKNKWNRYYRPEIKDWKKNKKKFLKERVIDPDEYRFFDFYISKNSEGKHIGWDIPWIYKLILMNKKTILPQKNLIKNIGFNFDPSGKGARKFRNLKISSFKYTENINANIFDNIENDKYLRSSFYHRKNIFVLIIKKFQKIIKNF